MNCLQPQTPRRAASRRRAPTLEDMTTGFCAAGAAIAVTDAGLHIVAVNAAYAAMTGCAPEDLMGRRLQVGDGVGPPRPPCDAPPPGVQCQRHWEGEVAQRHRDGQVRPVWMSVDALSDGAGAVRRYVVTCTDISALKREQEALRHEAQHDALTGLPQRALFDATLRQTIAAARRHGRPFALLFIDVDHFKRVNDTWGHDIGDRLLHEIGQRLRQSVRAEDLVARLGGDEFTVLLQDVASREQAAQLAAVMLAAIGRGFVAEGLRLRVSASFGVALFPDDADSADGLVRAADAAMYRAKHEGRGRIASAGERRTD